jgi:uncharacterized membrane protein SpoIIM required for sporulation
VDLDAFVSQHAGEWQRLDTLARRRRLTGAEVDELVLLYRRAASSLAQVQSRAPDQVVLARLSGLLARARAATVGGSRRSGWAALGHGITVDFPVVVYRAWRWWGAVAMISWGVALAMMIYIKDHPRSLSKVIDSQDVRQLVDHDFAGYYRAHPARSFAAQVWTNNALVAAMCMLLGVTMIGTIYFLAENVVNLGLVGGAMLGAGRGGLFWGLILPHGLLELTAVFVSAGVGLQMGWAWIAPGALPRSESLARAGRAAVVASIGLVGVLFVSGLIEAFVTPSGLPTAARLSIGILAEVAFLAYVIVLGRRGVRLGSTGDLDADERESVLPVA